MKTRIATIMLMLGLFVASTAFANEPVPAKDYVKKEIKQAVKKRLSYPQFAIDNKTECYVYVSITVNENGRLEVDCANCECTKLKDYVVKTIEKIKADDMADYAGQNILLKIKFDLI